MNTDTKLLNMLIEAIDYSFLQTNGEYDKSLTYPVIDKLRYIKHNRPQKQCCFIANEEELAAAKKDAFNESLDKIEYHSGEPTFEDGWCTALKYIRQKQWKPNELELASLGMLIEHPDRMTDYNKENLKSLYEQLKAL